MTATTRLFSHSQSARFYNALGATLDTQSFYEAAALRDLAAHLELETSESVIEFGCGTGRFAAELLRAHLSPKATYLGVDNSTTMVDLARSRVRQFGERELTSCNPMGLPKSLPRMAPATGSFQPMF